MESSYGSWAHQILKSRTTPTRRSPQAQSLHTTSPRHTIHRSSIDNHQLQNKYSPKLSSTPTKSMSSPKLLSPGPTSTSSRMCEPEGDNNNVVWAALSLSESSVQELRNTVDRLRQELDIICAAHSSCESSLQAKEDIIQTLSKDKEALTKKFQEKEKEWLEVGKETTSALSEKQSLLASLTSSDARVQELMLKVQTLTNDLQSESQKCLDLETSQSEWMTKCHEYEKTAIQASKCNVDDRTTIDHLQQQLKELQLRASQLQTEKESSFGILSEIKNHLKTQNDLVSTAKYNEIWSENERLRLECDVIRAERDCLREKLTLSESVVEELRISMQRILKEQTTAITQTPAHNVPNDENEKLIKDVQALTEANKLLKHELEEARPLIERGRMYDTVQAQTEVLISEYHKAMTISKEAIADRTRTCDLLRLDLVKLVHDSTTTSE
eukprot:PhF_6_TR20986/c0_g1_i1/m.30105